MANVDLNLQAQRARRAYLFGIINGVLFTIGAAFIDPVTVLPTFVSRLSDSEIAVGLISAIGMSGWFLPQLLAAKYLQPQPYKRPFYIFAAVLRVLGLLSVIPPMYFLGVSQPPVALAAFFVGYSVYSLAGGVSGPAFLDIVAKTVPGNRLGAFFGHRQCWGGLGAIASGALVRLVLSSESISFPSNYVLFLVLDLLLAAPGFVLFALIHEPPGDVTDPEPMLPFLRSAPGVIREHGEFALLIASRLLSGAVGIALPFYIVYCRRVLQVPEATAGTYVSLQMAGSVMLMPLWAYLNDRKGPRALLISLSGLYLFVVGLALIASLLPHVPAFGRATFMVVFFPLAAIGSGNFMGYTSYLLAIAPEHKRPLYIGIQNTLFAVTSLLPLLGGAMVAAASFPVLFATAGVFAAASLLITARLPRAGVGVSG